MLLDEWMDGWLDGETDGWRDEGQTDLPSGGETLQLSPDKDDVCALIG